MAFRRWLGCWVFLFLLAVAPLFGQGTVTLKEPKEQCYQDLKTVLPQAVRWDDEHYTVYGAPFNAVGGEVKLFIEARKSDKPDSCDLLVAIDSMGSMGHTTWDARNQFDLQRIAAQLKAQIVSVMKKREKGERKAK